jgi:hypothetical protein
VEEPDRQDPLELDFWFDRWPLGLLLMVLAISVVAPVLTAIFYGGNPTWTGMATGFSATALAFLVALAWDRRQRLVSEHKEAEAERRREEAAREAEHERRETEARRRFSAVALELERLEASLRRTVDEQQQYAYFFPDLPSGSWASASGPLGMIISNYGLMADLSTFYGHVEELRWRLRFKAQPDVDQAGVGRIIDALARQMLNDVSVLLAHTRRQVAQPDVKPLLDDSGGLVVARRQLTGAIRAVDVGLLTGGEGSTT